VAGPGVECAVLGDVEGDVVEARAPFRERLAFVLLVVM
jgi:hypothetical protein